MLSLANSSETNRLVERARGHQPAAADLFARHQERLRRMIRLRLDRRLRERFTSSAVLQEVFAEATRRLHEYLQDRSLPFFLWVRRIAGECIQALNLKHLGEGAEPAQEVSIYRQALPQVDSVSLAAQLLGQMTAAGQAAVRAEMQLRLQDALNSMDPLDREVLALCHFEELSEDEMAVVLELDKGTATVRYLRALKRLKEILKTVPGFFDKK